MTAITIAPVSRRVVGKLGENKLRAVNGGRNCHEKGANITYTLDGSAISFRKVKLTPLNATNWTEQMPAAIKNAPRNRYDRFRRCMYHHREGPQHTKQTTSAANTTPAFKVCRQRHV